MRTRVIDSISTLPAAQWNALSLADCPFVRHEFLHALELTGCVGADTGWQPHHLVLEDNEGRLCAAMPLYLKEHSWGEFVFDFSWARAYHQVGLEYYPKLVSISPFTPATGPRLLVADTAAQSPAQLRSRLAQALIEHATSLGLSSAHVLFVEDGDRQALQSQNLLWRQDCQFHWHNRNYRDFAAFVSEFRADKRKKLLRERRRVTEAGIVFQTLAGECIEPALWEVIFALSASTFAMRGNEHYLNPAFLQQMATALPGSVMVKLALLQGQPVATAIFFRSAQALYGRYWGALADFHSLHFETCYHQGIEYCIEHGLSRFEPGTQGEHKVARGFLPALTTSAHWVADTRFRTAIARSLDAERPAVDQYMLEVTHHSPYRREAAGSEAADAQSQAHTG